MCKCVQKNFENVAEKISAVVDFARGNFILVNLAGKGAFLITQLK